MIYISKVKNISPPFTQQKINEQFELSRRLSPNQDESLHESLTSLTGNGRRKQWMSDETWQLVGERKSQKFYCTAQYRVTGNRYLQELPKISTSMLNVVQDKPKMPQLKIEPETYTR